jgi:hypothetical protein
MQQQQQLDTSNARDSSAHKPPWQQQQPSYLLRHPTTSTSSSRSATPWGAAAGGAAGSTLLRRSITVASTSPHAATAAADDDKEPFRSVISVPSWVFGAKQQLQQQQHTQARASRRLHNRTLAPTAAADLHHRSQQQNTRMLKILLAGYCIDEAANDLLPLLLEFAPAGSSVVVAVPRAEHDVAGNGQQQQQQQQLPEGLDWEGVLEAEEEPQHAGAAPVLHSVSYRCVIQLQRGLQLAA